MRLIITSKTCHICAKGVLDTNFNKQLLTNYQIFTKLPQIPHIHKKRNFVSFIGTFLDQLILPYKFYGRDMQGTYFFYFCQLWAVKPYKLIVNPGSKCLYCPIWKCLKKKRVSSLLPPPRAILIIPSHALRSLSRSKMVDGWGRLCYEHGVNEINCSNFFFLLGL